jgi:hypothetical protein
MSPAPPAIKNAAATGDSGTSAPSAVPVTTLPRLSTAMHRLTVAQETPYKPEDGLLVPWTLVTVHAGAPPIGSMLVTTLLCASTATHSKMLGHETATSETPDVVAPGNGTLVGPGVGRDRRPNNRVDTPGLPSTTSTAAARDRRSHHTTLDCRCVARRLPGSDRCSCARMSPISSECDRTTLDRLRRYAGGDKT